jgi:hypothetical protein
MTEWAVTHLPHPGLVDRPEREPLLFPRIQRREVLVSAEGDLVEFRVGAQHLGQRALVLEDRRCRRAPEMVVVLPDLHGEVYERHDHADRAKQFGNRPQGFPVQRRLASVVDPDLENTG